MGLNLVTHPFELETLGLLGSLLPEQGGPWWILRVKYAQEKRFKQQCMGLRPLPYNCLRKMRRAEEFVQGDRNQTGNQFEWDEVKLNLPGMRDYTPLRCRVYMVRKDGRLVAKVVWYYNDG